MSGITRLLRALALPLLVTFLFLGLYGVVVRNMPAGPEGRAAFAAAHTAARFRAWFKTYAAAADTAAALSSLPGNGRRLELLYAEVSKADNITREMIFQREGGPILLMTNGETGKPSPGDPAYTEWTHRLSAPLGETNVQGPFPSFGGGDRQELLAPAPLLNEEKQRVGAVGIRIPLCTLADRARQMFLSETDGRHILIVGPKGILLSAGTESESFSARHFEESASFKAFRASPSSRAALVTIAGEPYFAGREKMDDNGHTVYLFSPAAEELEKASFVKKAFVAGWGLCLSLLLLQGRFAGSSLSGRVKDLDVLTGAGNRPAFERALARIREERLYPVSLLLLEVRGLKGVNAAGGRPEGDAVIKRAGALLLRTVREQDGVFRIDGNRFAVLVRAGFARAAALADRIEAGCAAARKNVNLPPVALDCAAAEALNDEEFASFITRAEEELQARHGGNAAPVAAASPDRRR